MSLTATDVVISRLLRSMLTVKSVFLPFGVCIPRILAVALRLFVYIIIISYVDMIYAQ